MSFILTRHAKSSHNRDNVFAGSRLDTRLTAEGRLEAKNLAIKIADKYSFDIIICSGLLRTYQTSLIFKKAQFKKYGLDIPILKTPLLNEVDVGVLSGMKPELALIEHPSDYKKLQSCKIEDWYFTEGESLLDLQKRYLKLVEFLKKYQHQNVLLVGHAMFNQIILKNNLGIINCQFDHGFFIELNVFQEKYES